MCGRVGAACRRRRRRRDAGDPGWPGRGHQRQAGALPAVRRSDAGQLGRARSRRHAGDPEAGARGRRHRQGRARPEVRGGDPRAGRRRAGRPRPRHHAGRLPARRLALEPGPRAGGARTARLQGAHRRRRARQGRQGGALRDAAASRPARLRRRARRSVVAAGRTLHAGTRHRRCRRGVSRARAAAGADPGWSGTGRRARRCPRARHAGRAAGAGADDAGHRDPSPGRRDVQYRLAQAARRDPVREAEAAGAEAHRDDANAVHRGGGARGAGPHPRPAAADPGMAQPVEAEGHLHRRAAARWCIRSPAGSTPCSTRRWPPRGV